MQSKDLYTQTNNGLTLISTHWGNYQYITIIFIAIILSSIIVPFFIGLKNELFAYLSIPVLMFSGFIFGMKCTYVRCCTINTLTKKIRVKEKFIYKWKKMEFKIADTIIHAQYYPETDGNETSGTLACWDVTLRIKNKDKTIIGKRFYNEEETKNAMKQLASKLFPSLELLTYDEIFEKCEKEINQIKFK